MLANTVGFVGGGRITRIILGGWQKAGFTPAGVVVSEPNSAVLAKLQSRFPAVRAVPNDLSLLEKMEYVFLAVHPPVLRDVLKSLAGRLRSDAVVVSLAPKISVAQISTALEGFARIARVIPNAPSLIGAGFNPVSFGTGLDETGRAQVLALLGLLGKCPVVPEDHLEAYAVLTAMGPTYLWFQLQQLRELGLSFGLAPADVDAGLAAMATGATQTLFASGLQAGDVMDLIPVKPLQEEEEAIRTAYKTRLNGLYQKLKA